MLDIILHYTTLIFAVGCFTVIYFKLLRSTVNKVTSSTNTEGKVATVYTSFMARLLLAFAFFYCLLKYYNEIRDMIIMVVVFVFIRYLIVRHERASLLKQTTTTKNDNTTGFSHKNKTVATKTKSAVSTGKYQKSQNKRVSIKSRTKTKKTIKKDRK